MRVIDLRFCGARECLCGILMTSDTLKQHVERAGDVCKPKASPYVSPLYEVRVSILRVLCGITDSAFG